MLRCIRPSSLTKANNITNTKHCRTRRDKPLNNGPLLIQRCQHKFSPARYNANIYGIVKSHHRHLLYYPSSNYTIHIRSRSLCLYVVLARSVIKALNNLMYKFQIAVRDNITKCVAQ